MAGSTAVLTMASCTPLAFNRLQHLQWSTRKVGGLYGRSTQSRSVNIPSFYIAYISCLLRSEKPMVRISRLRRRLLTISILALTLSAALGLSLLTLRHTYAAPGLVQLSSDPYTNTRNEHQTEVSPASFSSGSTIVSAFQVS